MNIRFSYLYRDAGNFKNWGEVVFSNPREVEVASVVLNAKRTLIDQAYFFARTASVPSLYFKEYDDELDHSWHEVHTFQETNDPPTDPLDRDIEEFIYSLRSASEV